jgi:hypothetical protein
MGLTGSNIVDLIAHKLMAPPTTATCRTSPTSARAGRPFYDRESRFTSPYVVWMDDIGWRNDKVKNSARTRPS